jgi:hypothetical protein
MVVNLVSLFYCDLCAIETSIFRNPPNNPSFLINTL